MQRNNVSGQIEEQMDECNCNGGGFLNCLGLLFTKKNMQKMWSLYLNLIFIHIFPVSNQSHTVLWLDLYAGPTVHVLSWLHSMGEDIMYTRSSRIVLHSRDMSMA